VIAEAEPPSELSVRGWTRIEKGSGPKGRRSFEYRLTPIHEGGEVSGWLAHLNLRVKERLYVFVHGSWEETDECGGGSGAWSFYLKTRDARPYESGILVLKRRQVKQPA
jgi:hypothetical protein